ncbi:MAG: translocation/assembly module TamB [Staphylococcus sp.]|nr:translocation/assembly module TamB [Staphylococcus sp.]
MKTLYRILRFTLVIVIVLPLAVPLLLYVLLSLPGVQQEIAGRAERELSALLGTSVEIGEVSVAPFNRVVLNDVVVKDMSGTKALTVGHLGAGISIGESLWKHHPVISYVEIIDLDLRLYKDSAGAQLNIQPIIDRFKSEEKKEPAAFDLAVNLLVIRRSDLRYDVRNVVPRDSGMFDPNHIHVTDLRADICAPRISDKGFEVEIKRMGANEQSGLLLREFTSSVVIGSKTMTVNNFLVELDNSRLALNDMTFTSPLSEDFNVSGILKSSVETLPDSYLLLSDLSPFVKELGDINERLDIDFEFGGSPDSIVVSRVDLEFPERDARISTHGFIGNLTRGRDSVSVDLRRLNVVANVDHALGFMASPSSMLHSQYEKLLPLAALGDIDLLGDLTFTPVSLDFNGSLNTACGNLDIDGGFFKAGSYAPMRVDGRVSSVAFDPSHLLPQLAALTEISFDSEANLVIVPGGGINGNATLSLPKIDWNGYSFTDISAKADFAGNRVDAELNSSSPLLDFSITGGGDLRGEAAVSEFFADVRHVSFSPFVKSGRFQNYALACGIDASVKGRNPDDLVGWLKIVDINLSSADDKTLDIPYIELEAAGTDSARLISLRSPQADADLTGRFKVKKIADEVKNILATVYPTLIPVTDSTETGDIDCRLTMTVKEDTTLSRFFKLPVDVIYPATLNSYVKGGAEPVMGLDFDIPYLKNKDKLIEGSRLSVLVDGALNRSEFTANTAFPTKDGLLNLKINSAGSNDSIDTYISWTVDRQAEFKGNFDFTTLFSRIPDTNELLTEIAIKPSQMVFNDSAWTVNPGAVHIAPGRIVVDNINGGRRGQSLSINGVASADSVDHIVLKLNNIDLDYIFDSLQLSDAVQFGGRATGDFYAMRVLSPEPILYTPRLQVEGLKYNNCVMGDGDIRSSWDNATKSVKINAVINQINDRQSLIDGYIKPMTEELDFKFVARSAPVGFMAPFMAAFTSRIGGEVSGNAHLYGTFKDIDMSGDIYVKNLSMKLDFTNVTYTTTDSVHIRPGRIQFDNVRLKDRDGKSALLSGYVTHNYFHDPSFRFDIREARDFLVYDVNEQQTEDPWYGRIYGNGSASVIGVPGKVDINVNMATAPKSTFTFVLSDAEQALDYTFITLRDRDKAKKDSIAALDPTPLIVRQLKERIKKEEAGAPSIYAMSFEVDINPTATINLIMDPVGGDKITAHGSGHLRMNYSSDGDLRMYGDYTINRGSYNFTLQDIIIKDFSIRDGSRISFLGDPYAAQLDIVASYTVNANLSDLDESFLEDRELNRTNVPVDALMIVKGDIRQPEISFDLDFPTLTRDIYRKVRSIVSTEDMMNRQIIYLLALNKFYTPDYMTATHGNELVSVVSSTLSSRLSSMLGQLSDNWSIAPAIRSDRHDFSDVEVDLALSSHLLNNRLLFNGNLGYRDKSLNNNSFIGDFDIRYLLNRSGSIQLKAYNRYNDQNYYLKSALTTQGVGIVFKRDFDNLFSFLRPKRKAKTEEDKDRQAANDSTAVETDSLKNERRRISADSIFDTKAAE